MARRWLFLDTVTKEKSADTDIFHGVTSIGDAVLGERNPLDDTAPANPAVPALLTNLLGFLANRIKVIIGGPTPHWWNNPADSLFSLDARTTTLETDIAALGPVQVWPTHAIVSAATTMSGDDVVWPIDTLGGAFTLTLPGISGLDLGRFYVIEDVGGAFNTANLTLAAGTGDSFKGGATSKTLATANGKYFVSRSQDDSAGDRWAIHSWPVV